MKEILARPVKKKIEVNVPGSKSYTHRLVIAAALSHGTCRIDNILRSEDTLLTIDALKAFGADISVEESTAVIKGVKGRPAPYDKEIWLGNSGTSTRLLTGIAALGQGVYRLTGTRRMQERPMQDLLDGLCSIGISARAVNGTGCPPIEITGGRAAGGEITLDCSLSSQFLSSVLLMAPCTENGVRVNIAGKLVSRPYIGMTLDIMKKFGIAAENHDFKSFYVPGGQTYKSGTYAVEPDCSNAGYFWAAAAVTGKSVKVMNISETSQQGDVRFVEVLKKIGCDVRYESDGITVSGGKLSGIEIDMSDMPDIVPTLAVVAAFAEGTTLIRNVAHLREKECDRIGSVVAELMKMGVDAKAAEDGMIIRGGRPRGAVVETYDDHRMAMCFSIAGLAVPGVRIKDEGCVAKSFPDYWDVFEGIYTASVQ